MQSDDAKETNTLGKSSPLPENSLDEKGEKKDRFDVFPIGVGWTNSILDFQIIGGTVIDVPFRFSCICILLCGA